MSGRKKIVLWSALGLAGGLLLSLVLLANYDWNRAKPWLNARVSEATGRPFAIEGDLALSWHHPQGSETGWRRLVPWPLLSAQQVRLGNPEWADAAPNMAEVRHITFSINPLALLNHRIAIPTLVLGQPDLVLQRAADGRTNWTFKSNGPGKWSLELGRLQLNEGKVRIVDAIKHADVTAQISSLEPDREDDYRIEWKIGGKFNRADVSGSGKAGALLSLQDSSHPYPIEADLRIGSSAMHARGTVARPHAVAAIDVQLKLSGASMADLYPIIGVLLPDTPPFSTSGHLTGSPGAGGGTWNYQNFSGKVGASDLSGSLRYQAKKPRPELTGTVSSQLLRLEDLGPVIGHKAAQTPDGNKQPADKALPVKEFRTDRWNTLDAHVKFTGHRIVRSEALPIDDMTTDLHLQDGVLSLTPLNFGVAGGKLASNVKLDGRGKAIKAEMKISARSLKLKQLFPKLDLMKASIGEVNGDALLTSTGNSIADLLGSSNGEIKALVNQGTISKLLLDQIGLNVGSIVLTKLFGDKQVNINCMASEFAVSNGLMESKIFVVDTDEAVLLVSGQINLAHEQLNLTINPRSRGVHLVSLRAPIYVTGSFKKPSVNVDKGVLASKAGGAIALGALAPVITALLPLINVGNQTDSGCNRLLAEAQIKPVAPPPGKTAARK
jgi:uncharacterized protein involved in outer membrane biogenesis